jgi:hypothetical protein
LIANSDFGGNRPLKLSFIAYRSKAIRPLRFGWNFLSAGNWGFEKIVMNKAYERCYPPKSTSLDHTPRRLSGSTLDVAKKN